MTSYENVAANINQIFNSFDNFVNLYESSNWLKTISKEDIKTYFKISMFVEKSIENFKSKSCLETFLNTLNAWWLKKNRTRTYDVSFFELASDHLMAKILKCNILSSSIVDSAVRMYTSVYPKERFEKMLHKTMLNAYSLNTIADFILATESVNFKELECRLLLNNWALELISGRADSVKAVIGDMLTNFKIVTSLTTIIYILSLKDITEIEVDAQKFVLDIVLPKMCDRSILSKNFWLTLFKNVDKQNIILVCVKFDDFLKHFLNFIIYIGCMMNYEVRNSEELWIGDANISICPEITYNDLRDILKSLCNSNDIVKKSVQNRITEAKSNTDTILWAQLEKEL